MWLLLIFEFARYYVMYLIFLSLVGLVDGSLPSEGRVEVLINSRWGTIKDENQDNREANVVCSQLGYASGGIAYSGSYFGEGEGPVLLNNFKCAGTESSLFRCSHSEIFLDSCHSQDAGVVCFDLSKYFIRLITLLSIRKRSTIMS